MSVRRCFVMVVMVVALLSAGAAPAEVPVPIKDLYTLTDGGWLLQSSHHGDAKVRAKPFAEVELDIQRWWLTPPAP